MRRIIALFLLLATPALADGLQPPPFNPLIPGPIGTTVPGAIIGTTIWQSSRNSYYAKPSNPANTSSTTYVQMGLGSLYTITPSFSGRIRIVITGIVGETVALATTNIYASYGTGTAPANGAAASGANAGSEMAMTAPGVGGNTPFSLYGEVTGLSLGTPVWVDLQAKVTSGSAFPANITVMAEEF